jgi:GT2 family glycosyltransferase
MSAAGDRPPLGVVIVTHESEAVLGGLLASLEPGLEGVDWRGVVVDNGSSDRTLAIARRHPGPLTTVAVDANPGFAAAVNRGLDELGDGDVLILNPDTRLPRGAAATLREAARPGVGIVAPRLVDARGALRPSLRHEPSIGRALAETLLGVRLAGRLGWGETVLDPRAYERATVADWASGAALLVTAEARATCGPWDESFFLYSEDSEFALRARDRGLATRLEPSVEVTHLGGESRTDPGLWALLAVNKVELYRRRHGAAAAAAFRAVAALRELRFAAAGNRASRRAARALVTGAEAGVRR